MSEQLHFGDIIVKAIPTNRYVFPGEVTKKIKTHLGVYISPDYVARVASKDKRIKRMWTPQGWKYIRSLTLSDYISDRA